MLLPIHIYFYPYLVSIKLDKDITIYDETRNRSYPLSYKSKLVNVLPGLPKTTRLFITQEGNGAKYEFGK